MKRRYIIIISTIIVIGIILSYIVYRRYYYVPPYPSEEPFLGPKESDPGKFSDDIEYFKHSILPQLLTRYVFDPNDTNITDISISYPDVAINEPILDITIYNSKYNMSVIVEYDVSDKYVPGLLFIKSLEYKKLVGCHVPRDVSKDEALSMLRDIFTLLHIDTRLLDKNNDIHIEIIDVSVLEPIFAVDIDFRVYVYGYPVYDDDGTVHLTICGDKYVPELVDLPNDVLWAYKRGLFVRPPVFLPVSREDAYKKAVEYLRSLGSVIEYRSKYTGIYWVFPYNKFQRYYYPVPHLVYIYYFRASFEDGYFYRDNVYIDALDGKVIKYTIRHLGTLNHVFPNDISYLINNNSIDRRRIIT